MSADVGVVCLICADVQGVSLADVGVACLVCTVWAVSLNDVGVVCLVCTGVKGVSQMMLVSCTCA